MNDFIHCGCDVVFMLDRCVHTSHVDADTNFIWFFRFGKCYDGAYLWDWAICFFDYVFFFQLMQGFRNFFMYVKRNSLVWLGYWLNALVDVYLDLVGCELADSFESVIIGG